MEHRKSLALRDIYSITNSSLNKKLTKEYELYTPKMIKKYKSSFKTLLKLTKDRNQTLYIMYGKVQRWYESEENINLNMEKIHIRTKLGSYLSGGCGIGASLLTSLTASAVFAYANEYIKKLGPISLICYVGGVALYGITVLSKEDDQVEMYNMFLEVLDHLDKYKTE